jgi:sugar phosphate isomerase/epimerase
MMKRIIAVNSNCYHGYSIDEAIDGIASAGFHYIELTATKGWTEHVFPTMQFDELWRIKEKLAEADLVPFSMSGHCNLMDQDRIPDFIDNMRLAHFYGCDTIASSVGEAHIEDKAVLTDEEVADQISTLLPYLDEYELELVLENHGEHATGMIIKGIVDLIDSPLVSINYDTANVIYFAGIDPLEDIPGCVDQIGYMHVKDKLGGKGEWHFPALGQGKVDFPKILDLLEKSGNGCPWSIEIEFTSDGPKDLQEVNQAVKDSYDYLKSPGLAF